MPRDRENQGPAVDHQEATDETQENRATPSVYQVTRLRGGHVVGM